MKADHVLVEVDEGGFPSCFLLVPVRHVGGRVFQLLKTNRADDDQLRFSVGSLVYCFPVSLDGFVTSPDIDKSVPMLMAVSEVSAMMEDMISDSYGDVYDFGEVIM